MIGDRALAATALTLLLAGCVSPEEQRAADQQTCAGYGFAPGTDAFANCMMTTAHKREEQQAADRRQQEAIDAQAKRDREAQQARDDAAAAAASQSSRTFDRTGFPTVEVPKVEMPDTSGMTCTRTVTSSENAGSMTENCHN